MESIQSINAREGRMERKERERERYGVSFRPSHARVRGIDGSRVVE